jgi:hypothetical protein
VAQVTRRRNGVDVNVRSVWFDMIVGFREDLLDLKFPPTFTVFMSNRRIGKVDSIGRRLEDPSWSLTDNITSDPLRQHDPHNGWVFICSQVTR